ncbi:Cl-channel voltage-gated family protein [Candidatus Sulfotelmatomonas gaucii]|uniref:Cl-channel voltage-gated family protein n=1 Tax=Candidatus Sulfuritelmatomonas gaucii TaxID=2043161 RepID=A0A2N9LUG7_9BACT|nr:Cl-channel voltage-gated family protein [Candidatus Sulfotelmatomonas gaucii]
MRSRPSALRDFTVDRRVWLLTGVAAVIGVAGAIWAVILLRAIAFFTNVFYYHRFTLAMVGPAGSPEAAWIRMLAPIVGGIIVGLMAYYGSDKIRGHGIPEAIEAILLKGARVEAKVSILKPLSAAIAIGSGGPFGAEGPIIMTGGAFGSLVGQWLKLSDAERTTLLVAGAAAGMSATFAAPIASILLAVELLLFEWRPRSLVPVTVASLIAAALRIAWLGHGPLFPVVLSHGINLPQSLLVAGPLGIVVGFASAGLSRLMYSLEDGFELLSRRFGVHWIWWPAIGGIGIGIGGLFFSRGLGVGYDNIAELLRGNAPVGLLIGLVVAKSLMWAFSLSSGTSGGVLAPLLMIGAAIGESGAHLAHMPVETQALWAMMGMGAMLSGAVGVPLTAILFSLELTHAQAAVLPLSLACAASYLITCLVMPRSIMTEKIARRGYHLSREYGVDPLEMITVAEVMTEVPPEAKPAESNGNLLSDSEVFAYADQTCRAVAEEMATTGLLSLPVLDRDTDQIIGTVSAGELLAGRRRAVRRESDRTVSLMAESLLTEDPVGARQDRGNHR